MSYCYLFFLRSPSYYQIKRQYAHGLLMLDRYVELPDGKSVFTGVLSWISYMALFPPYTYTVVHLREHGRSGSPPKLKGLMKLLMGQGLLYFVWVFAYEALCTISVIPLIYPWGQYQFSASQGRQQMGLLFGSTLAGIKLVETLTRTSLDITVNALTHISNMILAQNVITVFSVYI
ncbi:hypothetical protein CONPUDRAFT_76037 [Coniophora puteana RWD-64-598 SS2]|uniref:Uncharacterized protein n=1 Tax=Coniophora puteana (strain RWD-64-598) TaxID=741705 RepID=A0A5M3MED1_CONPW|nr:uncharacterized protein CONPUDRAFT_76037 [Coniophora puteana RWD-64-598 SS2]EIW77270.1 hypothetical protein CONPUDRAFT_76037 [Coniophora puteana RWD-64-598 SS2]